MSTQNDSLLYNLGVEGFPVNDNNSALATTQATGTSIIGAAFRVTNSVANGRCILKHVTDNEAQPLVFLINDSPNTIVLQCSAGDNLSGSANGTLNVPTGQSAIAVRVPPQVVRGGGGGGTNDWRVAVIP